MAKTQQFIPKYPDKYVGDPRRIIARSSWEYAYMSAIDSSPLVAKWTSEPRNLQIKYLDPVSNKLKTYWPDFLIVYKDNSRELVEIKPLKESKLTNKSSTYDKLMFARNVMKWQAAEKFAKKIGARFRVLTEQQMGRRK